MIRVLVVEDSITDRTLLLEILRSDPEIQIVGEAKDGVEAVKMTQALRPQVVTMDIRMPRMDGLAATKEIMTTAPTPIVIVTGSTEGHDSETAIHALRAGAVCVLYKPHGPDKPEFDDMAQKLIATVKDMSQVKVVRHWRSATRSQPAPARSEPRQQVRREIVAIATSTGGPAALQQVLSDLPRNFTAPILVVQHITAGFTAGLAAWLNSVCGLQVNVARHGEPLTPHTVFLAPDDRHLGVSASSIVLSSAAPVAGFRPSGTFLFESVARVFGPSAVGVIMTGMGEDGVAGLRSLRQAGATIIAQDQDSSVVFGMPGAAVAAGLPDQVLSLPAIAPRLVELIGV